MSAFNSSYKLLQILPVCVGDLGSNRTRQTLCLLDAGSDTHVMTEAFAERIGLKGEPIVSVTQYTDGSSSGKRNTHKIAC